MQAIHKGALYPGRIQNRQTIFRALFRGVVKMRSEPKWLEISFRFAQKTVFLSLTRLCTKVRLHRNMLFSERKNISTHSVHIKVRGEKTKFDWWSCIYLLSALTAISSVLCMLDFTQFAGYFFGPSSKCVIWTTTLHDNKTLPPWICVAICNIWGYMANMYIVSKLGIIFRPQCLPSERRRRHRRRHSCTAPRQTNPPPPPPVLGTPNEMYVNQGKEKNCWCCPFTTQYSPVILADWLPG